MKDKWVWLVLVLICIPAALPLLRGDFFHFSDENQIGNLYQMMRAIGSGQLPPRWAPDMSYGYGYPFFNYFYPLPFYLGSVFLGITGSLITALKWVFLVTIPLSAIFMYEWVSRQAGKWAGFMAGVVYVYTPYRAVDLYIRGAVGETLAFVFLPLVALGTFMVFERRSWRWVGILGVVVAGFLLSHNLAPLIFLPWLGLYALWLAIEKKDKKSLGKVLVGLILGVLASSYFWFPAFWERGLLVGQTPFNYINHFPFIRELIVPYWGYGGSNPGSWNDMSFQVGVVNWLLAVVTGGLVVAAVVFRKVRVRLELAMLVLISLAGYLFLMNIRSNFLWKAFALSVYVQFPWRMLVMTTFLTSASVMFLPKEWRMRNVILGVLGMAALGLTVGYFRPSEYFNPGDDYFLNRFFANRTISGVREKVSSEYDLYSEDYLILPTWVKQRPSQLPAAKFTSGEGIRIGEIREENAVTWKTRIEAGKEGKVEINNYYFPGWEVLLDGEKIEPQVLSPYGNMGVRVPYGSHEIEVRWRETTMRKVVDYLSVVGGFVMVGLVLGSLIKKRR